MKAYRRHMQKEICMRLRITGKLTDLIDCAQIFHLGNLWAAFNSERVEEHMVVHAQGNVRWTKRDESGLNIEIYLCQTNDT